jgi:tetratricopeptide (TPR) repeat protein
VAKTPAAGLVVTVCREIAGITQAVLAQLAGVHRMDIVRAEKGQGRLTPGFLGRLMGFPEAVTEGLRLLVDWLRPASEERSFPPLGLPLRERRLIAGAALNHAAAQAERLAAARLADLIRADREHAEQDWLLMRAWSVEEWHGYLEEAPQVGTWALVERLAEESERAAAADPRRTLELAELACRVAPRIEGTREWRGRVEGWALAFYANALRVLGRFKASEAAFARAWTLWRAGAAVGPGPLDESRVYDLEASLRRDLREWPEALALLENALALCLGPQGETRVLIKLAFMLEQKGDVLDALAVLDRAEPLVDEEKEPRQMFGVRFNRVVNLLHLGRTGEAKGLLEDLDERAKRLDNDFDSVRLLWLRSRVAARCGDDEEAEAGLLQVRQEFAAPGLEFDTALADLELARIYLKQGRTVETRELAATAEPAFRRLGVDREAAEAVQLFWRAARLERATFGMVERALETLQRTRPCPTA